MTKDIEPLPVILKHRTGTYLLISDKDLSMVDLIKVLIEAFAHMQIPFPASLGGRVIKGNVEFTKVIHHLDFTDVPPEDSADDTANLKMVKSVDVDGNIRD